MNGRVGEEQIDMTDASTVRSLPNAEGDLAHLARSFRWHLEAENVRPRTIESYMEGLGQFDAFLASEQMPRLAAEIRATHVKAFVADLLGREKPNGETYSPATARARLAAIRSFYNWLIEDDEEDVGIDVNPAAGVKFPKNPERIMRIPTDSEVEAILRATTGKAFEQRRDRAIIALFIDNGVRLNGLAGLRLVTPDGGSDLDMDARPDGGVLYVTLKGGARRAIPFGRAARDDLGRYLRARSQHPRADLPWLWLGPKGRLTDSGIAQMVRRRWDEAGVDGLSVHSFRRYMAHSKLASGATEGDVAATGGWTDTSMVRRYGRALQDERAAADHARTSPLDRLRSK